jgi:hypothetical protein
LTSEENKKKAEEQQKINQYWSLRNEEALRQEKLRQSLLVGVLYENKKNQDIKLNLSMHEVTLL